MAVYIVQGKPGSGKSYESVRQWVFEAIKCRRKVITNLPLNLEVWRMFWPALDLDELLEVRQPGGTFSRPDHYGDPWRHPGLPAGDEGANTMHGKAGVGPLYVIDEAHKDLPSGATDRGVIEWFKEHRHEGADVVLMTQEARGIHRSILGLVQACYSCTNHAPGGYGDRYSVEVRAGWRRQDPLMGSSILRRYDQRYFPLYQSYSKGGVAGAETKVSSKPLHKRWYVKAAAIGLVFAIYQPFTSLSSIFSNIDGSDDDPPISVSQVSPVTDHQIEVVPASQSDQANIGAIDQQRRVLEAV